VAMGLYRWFLRRTIARVSLWQIGHTVNDNVTFGRPGPDERYKKINDDCAAPSAPASAGGEPRRVWVRGMDLNLIALGATYVDALCLNSIQGRLPRLCPLPAFADAGADIAGAKCSGLFGSDAVR
jgi:hypothetical protein